jgi:hypothetical protein
MSDIHNTVVNRKRARFEASLYVTLFMLVIALAGALLVIYRQGQKLDQTIQQGRLYTKLLVECTTPPELRRPPVVVEQKDPALDCYLRTKQNTNKVIDNVKEISIAAAACGAAYPGDVTKTQACVNRTLNHK